MLPDSASIQSTLRKAVAAIIGVVLSLVLLTMLLVAGFYLLVNAATLALVPLVGKPGAMAITGFVCLCLLMFFFYRMTRPPEAHQGPQDSSTAFDSPFGTLRSLIARNPLEAAALAFAVGFAEQSDPRLKKLLLQGGMVLMRQPAGSNSSEAGKSSNATASSAPESSAE